MRLAGRRPLTCEHEVGAGPFGLQGSGFRVSFMQQAAARDYLRDSLPAPPEPLASYYRARYYDPGNGRFASEDPIGFDAGGENFYAYTENNPIGFKDPRGLYTLQPHVPAPSAELDKFLKCMDGLVGGAGVTVSATTNGVHADRGHALGTSVDIKPPAGLSADTVFCYGGKCGAVRGLNESPAQGGQRLPTTTGDNYHFSLVQMVKHPTTPSAIPNRPECKPGSCSASK